MEEALFVNFKAHRKAGRKVGKLLCKKMHHHKYY